MRIATRETATAAALGAAGLVIVLLATRFYPVPWWGLVAALCPWACMSVGVFADGLRGVIVGAVAGLALGAVTLAAAWFWLL